MYNKKNLEKALKELNAFKARKNKYNFYTFDRPKKLNYDIFFSIGTRSTGKTSAIQRDIALNDFLENESMFVKLCRTKEELHNEFQADWWTEITIKTLNKYDIDICYKKGRYYINEKAKYIDPDTSEFLESKFISEGKCIGYVIPLYKQQQYKSINYESVTNIIFDEFALLKDYSYDYAELEHFKSFLSTVVRFRDNVKVWFIGNVLSPHNPYFEDFGINAMSLKAGCMYAFTDYEYYDEPATIGLEYGESLTDNIEDIPRLLRIKGNRQATGELDMYELPAEIINEDDWLITVLKKKDKELFNKFYSVLGGVMISIDTSKRFRWNKNLNRYDFKNLKYFIIKDINNGWYYLISKDKRTDYGLSLNLVDDNIYYYKYDDDIRNNHTRLPDDIIKGKKIYGDLDIYNIFERGVK